ncbi:MAG: LLM class F420-dependent oxidoreductase [Actinomycetota bacterium]|nr:LLM class F420-dependent oxidoreductase [Actinomycetota bacterium]
MRYILGLPTDHVESIDQFGTSHAIVEMATTAETLGFSGVFVTDHPAPPKSFLDTGGHHTLDPMITLAAAATSTKKIKLLTNLYIVAYRNPLLVAKMVASLDNLSLGRLILGVGAGYLKEEFQATGADYQNRGQSLDDYIEIMKQAWTGNPVSMKGYNFEAKEIISLPTPLPRNGHSSPPIWIGGNSKNALERVARFGEGWIPMATPKGIEKFVKTTAITDMAALAKRINDLMEIWELHGRKGKPFISIEPWDAGQPGSKKWDSNKYLERLEELSEMGVTHIPVMLSSIGRRYEATRSEFLETVNEYAQLIGINEANL